jgi:signal transduction histidine kinase
MAKTAASVPEEQHFILSTLSPSLAQRRLALAVVLALVAAFVITAGPLSTIQLGRIDAFIPAYAAAMFVIDSITAVLLFAQFSILRSRALLVIASGYLFTALILILYAQLLRAVLAQRREREARLITGDAVAATIAHEVKQPLSGMITNADAGLRWLDRDLQAGCPEQNLARHQRPHRRSPCFATRRSAEAPDTCANRGRRAAAAGRR